MALPVNGSTYLIPAYYSFYRPRKDERLSWPSWLTCSGHPSAAGQAQDRERDRRSTTVPRHRSLGLFNQSICILADVIKILLRARIGKQNIVMSMSMSIDVKTLENKI